MSGIVEEPRVVIHARGAVLISCRLVLSWLGLVCFGFCFCFCFCFGVCLPLPCRGLGVSFLCAQEYSEESYVPFMSVVIDTLAFKYLLETQDAPPLRPFHDMLDKARR